MTLLRKALGSPDLGPYESVDDWRPYIWDLDLRKIDRRSLLCSAQEIGIKEVMSTLLDEVENRAKINHYMRFRENAWTDVLTLSELFNSESSLASSGRFIDQRFINYLATNYEEIGFINWRKFEALIAEHFHRSGFEVELGPGRGDDGVDIRVWESGAERDPSTLVIIQCKRERRKIEKVVVKALAADVKWNGATKGLLVATTDWSPGARTVARTRDYPVEEVNSDAVRSWVEAMKTAGAGTAAAGSSSRQAERPRTD
ncbi:hypothetical protein BG452_06015 [Streptomyces sp. CBMA123]|nr:hypothetical protein [Streptomyces sp. CBMA123]